MRASLECDAQPARSSCCTRAATTPPASIRRRRSGTRSSQTVRARGLVPFLDIAYQGFGDGIDADGVVVRKFAATPGPLFVSSSFSKSFSLYGERVGALSRRRRDKDEAARVLSQLKRVIRANYSNPPTHGGQIVAIGAAPAGVARALGDRARRHARAHQARCARRWSTKLARARAGRGLSTSSCKQRGMFSYSGPEPRRRCSGCATSSRSTRSTPAASAWRRSTRRTSSTWPTRSRRCSATCRRLLRHGLTDRARHLALRSVDSAACNPL